MTKGKTKSNIKPDTNESKTIYASPPPGPKRNTVNINYLQVIEDSHYWTDINQMLEWLKYKQETCDVQYLKEGLLNTLKNGYNIQKIEQPNIQNMYPNISINSHTTSTYPEGTQFNYTK